MGSHTADELSNKGFEVSIFDCVESPYINLETLKFLLFWCHEGPRGSLIWDLLRNLLTRSETWPNMRCFLVTPNSEGGSQWKNVTGQDVNSCRAWERLG